MHSVRSFEKMVAVIAVPNLETIPRRILMWEYALLSTIEVKVLSWLEDAIPHIPAADTTPSQSFFNQVRQDNLRALRGINTDKGGKRLSQ